MSGNYSLALFGLCLGGSIAGRSHFENPTSDASGKSATLKHFERTFRGTKATKAARNVAIAKQHDCSNSGTWSNQHAATPLRRARKGKPGKQRNDESTNALEGVARNAWKYRQSAENSEQQLSSVS